MTVDKINVWDDARVQKRSAHLNGRTYGGCHTYLHPAKDTDSCPLHPTKLYHPTIHPSILNFLFQGYLYGEPEAGFRGTIFLVQSPFHSNIHSFLPSFRFTHPHETCVANQTRRPRKIHGFPDISMGWRYQIPMLLGLELRVVAPDCMGYGRTVGIHLPYSMRMPSVFFFFFICAY
jgi:hypothetical protein